ncbi:MAG: hypothetical protein NC452_13220 [Eubacterium sp.]|nr:hypothetical protein [Eubacterium sp.]
MKNINEFTNDWYGSLEELTEELTDEGYEVLEANDEYICCSGNEDDIQYVLHLGGTRTTLTIESVKKITI